MEKYYLNQKTKHILSLIQYEKHNYLTILAKDLGKKNNTLIDYLKKLEKQDIIKKDNKQKEQYNIKRYILTKKGFLLLNYFKELHNFDLKYKDILKGETRE